MKGPLSFEEQRKQMVSEQLAARQIKDRRVLEAMGTIPRHKFVHQSDQHLAYADGPLAIGESQTISQPYVVALMIELLNLEGDEKVLEVGTGSGYSAAILGYLARKVYTLERHASLAESAEHILNELSLDNVHVKCSDGSLGLPEEAPFDAIIVAAAAPQAPSLLLEQLSDGGILILPVGGSGGQRLQRWRRAGEKFTHDNLTRVSFVPLRGEQGWDSNSWSR
ncbi:MAG: protein-L-isoaspartate(D-aspartate) O-methyltransferase [Chloroflexi bacterium]|nr:protein-L-isoaspartate(D-aspartate) O-methyltransferase [Chloroflexota bacterium]